MSNVQLYTRALVTVDGSLLTEEANVTVTRNSGSQAVMTVSKGYAGESPGSGTVEIDVSSAVPAADFEFDPGEKMFGNESVEISVVAAGKTLTAVGFIISDNFKHAVNSESMLEFKFMGGISKFE